MNRDKKIATQLKLIGFYEDITRLRKKSLKLTYQSWSFYTGSKGIIALSSNKVYSLICSKKWSKTFEKQIKLTIDAELSPIQLSLF